MSSGFISRLARAGSKHTYNKNISLFVGEGPKGMWGIMGLCTVWFVYTGYRYGMHPEFRIMHMHEKQGIYGVNQDTEHGLNFRPFFMKRNYPVDVDPEDVPQNA